MMGFDEEHIDQHGECAAEIHRLTAALAEVERERKQVGENAQKLALEAATLFERANAAEAALATAQGQLAWALDKLGN